MATTARISLSSDVSRESSKLPQGPKPDGSYGWFVVFNSFICNMIVDGMQYTFSNFLTPISHHLNTSVAAASLIGSLLSGFYNFSGPIAGALGNKFGFRMVAIAGSIIAAMGLMLSYFAPDVYYLYFFYGILGGLGFGMIYMASVITTSVYFEKYRALAVSISVCGTGIGTFVFAPIGDALVNHFGWRWALVMEGAIILICTICGWAFKPLEIFKVVPISRKESDSGSGSAHGSFHYIADRRKTLPNEAYPTYREAIIHQADAPKEGERRSTVVSLMPKFQRESSEINGATSSVTFNIHLQENPEAKRQVQQPRCSDCCQRCCYNFWHCRCKKKDLTLGDRPMYRDDVFYGSDLTRLKYTDSERLQYHMSVTHVPDPKEVEEHLAQKCCICHHAFLRTCVTMTGANLLKSKIFAFLCVSSFLYTMGLYIPYVFIKDLAMSCNIEDAQAVWLLSAIGICNTAGRLISGIIKSFTNVNAAIFVLICLSISGLFSFIFLFCCGIECIATFSSMFGLFTAPFISLRPVIIVDFLGLEKLTNAFGLVLLSQGVASIIGPPLAGIVVETSLNYFYIMYLSGSLMMLSASALLISTIIKKRKKG